MELTLILHSTKELKDLESILYGQSYIEFKDLRLVVLEFESKKKFIYELINLGDYLLKDKDYFVFSCTEEQPLFN